MNHATELIDEIEEFHRQKEAIFVFIIGGLNHWVTLVINKTVSEGTNFFYLDSVNAKILNLPDENIVDMQK